MAVRLSSSHIENSHGELQRVVNTAFREGEASGVVENTSSTPGVQEDSCRDNRVRTAISQDIRRKLITRRVSKVSRESVFRKLL